MRLAEGMSLKGKVALISGGGEPWDTGSLSPCSWWNLMKLGVHIGVGIQKRLGLLLLGWYSLFIYTQESQKGGVEGNLRLLLLLAFLLPVLGASPGMLLLFRQELGPQHRPSAGQERRKCRGELHSWSEVACLCCWMLCLPLLLMLRQ